MYIIRKYDASDAFEMAKMFYETVHAVNAKDYSKEQLDVWALKNPDMDRWCSSFQGHDTWVAEEDGVIVGFGDIDSTGYLDRLYVHKDHQGQGIATAICDRLEHLHQYEEITTHASITARSFFESRGYMVQRKQQVERSQVLLTNYVMVKSKLPE